MTSRLRGITGYRNEANIHKCSFYLELYNGVALGGKGPLGSSDVLVMSPYGTPDGDSRVVHL